MLRDHGHGGRFPARNLIQAQGSADEKVILEGVFQGRCGRDLGLAGRAGSVWCIHHGLRIPYAARTGGSFPQQKLPAGTVMPVIAQAFSTESGGRKQAILQEPFYFLPK
jgi:hypothetical protein